MSVHYLVQVPNDSEPHVVAADNWNVIEGCLVLTNERRLVVTYSAQGWLSVCEEAE